MGLTPWWMVFPYIADYLGLDIFPVVFSILVALALFGLALVWWAERKWAA
jgi:hypothetical protein